MGLPIIQNDGSGGFFIVKVSNGPITHKMRFHVPEFGPPGAANGGIPHDCDYVGAPAGYETSVGRTFYELAVALRGMYNPAWQFSLAAVYKNSATGARLGAPRTTADGILTPQYPCPRPHTVRGTSNGGNAWYPGQVTVSFPTDLGGRFSLRMISSEEWDPKGGKDPVDPIAAGGSGATPITITVAYLTGVPTGVVQAWLNVSNGAAFYSTGAARSMISGHDGGLIVVPAVKTNCMNKRVRRGLRLT